MVSSAFTALAIEQIDVTLWGQVLQKQLIPLSIKYLKSTKRDWDQIKTDIKYFTTNWDNYLQERNLKGGSDIRNVPNFPSQYGVTERDIFYKKWSYNGWVSSELSNFRSPKIN